MKHTLGLVDEEEDEREAEEAARSPDEEDFAAKIGISWIGTDDVRSGVCNSLCSISLQVRGLICLDAYPIEQPVAGGSHRERLGANLQREDFTSNDPSARSPAAGKEEDVNTTGMHVSFIECRSS